MKKLKEMNGFERIAYRNIKNIFNWNVGGWYNCYQDDIIEDIPETIEEAKEIVYDDALNNWADGHGTYFCDRAPKEMRFAGTEFIKECIDHLFDHDGDALFLKELKNW